MNPDHITTTHDTPGTISRDKSRRIAALCADYFKDNDNRRAFEQWRDREKTRNEDSMRTVQSVLHGKHTDSVLSEL